LIPTEASETVEDTSMRAQTELKQRMHISDGQQQTPTAGTISLDTQYGTIVVEVAEPLIRLARKIQRSNDVDLAAAMADADLGLDKWENARRAAANERPDSVVLPYGVAIRLPAASWTDRRA